MSLFTDDRASHPRENEIDEQPMNTARRVRFRFSPKIMFYR